MKKVFILIASILLILLLPSILAINIEVKKLSSNEVMISDLERPAVFNLSITNKGAGDNFGFYNLLGFKMYPVGTVPIFQNQTKEIELRISPIGGFDHRGFYTLEYFIRSADGSEIKKELTFKVIDLKDAFEIGSEYFDPESNSVEIYIINKVNVDFGEINVKFNSIFFNIEKVLSLGPNQKQQFRVQLNKEDFKKLMAGFYTLKAEVSVENKKAEIEGIIKFDEKNITETTEKEFGFIINTKIIKKENEGNTVLKSETVLKKNIISRLFTSFSPEPDIVDRQGLTIYYIWSREIKPGEILEIVVKTNWLLPLIVILFIIVIVILAKQYKRTDLVLRKKVSFVKAKGGEFALKVSIFVHAKNYVERINIIDKLPPLVKLHERFGGEKPSKINEKYRKIEWDFEKLETGEIRVLSYFIYSKIGVVGKFALPATTAIFERDGKIKETESNKAFFVAEQVRDSIKD